MQIGRTNLRAPRPAHLIAQRTALQDKLAAAPFGRPITQTIPASVGRINGAETPYIRYQLAIKSVLSCLHSRGDDRSNVGALTLRSKRILIRLRSSAAIVRAGGADDYTESRTINIGGGANGY
jgi:hypothetical protein